MDQFYFKVKKLFVCTCVLSYIKTSVCNSSFSFRTVGCASSRTGFYIPQCCDKCVCVHNSSSKMFILFTSSILFKHKLNKCLNNIDLGIANSDQTIGFRFAFLTHGCSSTSAIVIRRLTSGSNIRLCRSLTSLLNSLSISGRNLQVFEHCSLSIAFRSLK